MKHQNVIAFQEKITREQQSLHEIFTTLITAKSVVREVKTIHL